MKSLNFYNKFHIVGDSHHATLRGFTGVKYLNMCEYYNWSPMSMYLASGKEKNHFLTLEREGLWILCFGEIDVRCLIYNQIHKKNRDENEVIESLVKSFIDTVTSFYSEIAIMSVVPPVKFYSGNYKLEIINSEFPFVGPDEDRSRYTKKINETLRKTCEEKDLIYINIYDSYKDSCGFLIKELSDGTVHTIGWDKPLQIMMQLGFDPYK
jgi:hypothetical protein